VETDLHEVELVDRNIQLLKMAPETFLSKPTKLMRDKVLPTLFYIETFLYDVYMWQPENVLRDIVADRLEWFSCH
jgi:hypothetical protein